MVLLPFSPQDFDISQVLEFALQNEKILEMLPEPKFTNKEVEEITKYRDLYKNIKYVANLVSFDIEGAEEEVRELGLQLSIMIEKAERKRDISKNLYCLHNDFFNQKNNLIKIMRFLLKKKQVDMTKSNNDVHEVKSSPSLYQSNEDYKLGNRKFKSRTEEVHKSRHTRNMGISDQMETSEVNADKGVSSNAFYFPNPRYLDVKKKGNQKSILFREKNSGFPEFPLGAENCGNIELITGAMGGLNYPGMAFSVESENLKSCKGRTFAAEGIVQENSTYPVADDQFCGLTPEEANQKYSSEFQYSSKTKEHPKNKRKSEIDVRENKVKKDNCLGEQIKSRTLTSETKATQTEMTDTGTRKAVEQDTVDNRTNFVISSSKSYDILGDGGEQPLKQEIYRASNIANVPDILQESLEKDTKAASKMIELTQQLSELDASRSAPISLEDVLGLKGQIKTEKPLASKEQCRNEYEKQTVDIASRSGNYTLVKSSYAYGFEDKRNEGPSRTKVSKLRTLEDSLIFFGLFQRLEQLEKSLEDVRRHRRTPGDHETVCKQFDKELHKLSREHHPDSVMRRGGSEKEVERAKELQTALNATRTVLNTINKIFLEDIDIDHKYEFFTKLDIGSLGNEDGVENHVYDVLFKISLVSEIKQENIIAEIRRFLTVGQGCIESYLQDDYKNFEKLRGKAVFHLKRCVEGYLKLHTELSEVVEECRKEKLDNIHPLMLSMRRECSKQLKHLEALLELTKLPFGEFFPMYKSSQSIDDYFVLPFVSYINVIMTCSIMVINTVENNPTGLWHNIKNFANSHFKKSRNLNVQISISDDDAISHLHYLAAYYSASSVDKSQYNRSTKEPSIREEHISKDHVKEEFLVRLKAIQDDLERKFGISDYIEMGTKRHIMKELKICNEMKAEFENKWKEVKSCIEEVSKNNDYMNRRLDELFKNSQKVGDELEECFADNKLFKNKIENYSHKKGSNLNEMFHS